MGVDAERQRGRVKAKSLQQAPMKMKRTERGRREGGRLVSTLDPAGVWSTRLEPVTMPIEPDEG